MTYCVAPRSVHNIFMQNDICVCGRRDFCDLGVDAMV